jgi:hypothetical protein
LSKTGGHGFRTHAVADSQTDTEISHNCHVLSQEVTAREERRLTLLVKSGISTSCRGAEAVGKVLLCP